MLNYDKKKEFSHPIKMILSESGVNTFVRANKKFDKISLPDGKLYYGIQLSEFSFPTLQKLVETNCINKIELSVLDYEVNKFEIIDIIKLLMFNFFYRKFNYEITTIFLNTTVIDALFQKRIYQQKNFLDRTLPQEIIDNNWVGSKTKEDMENELLIPLTRKIYEEQDFTDKEKNMKILIAKKFLSTIKNSTWLMLSVSQQTSNYDYFFKRIFSFLYKYVYMSTFSDYMGEVLLKIIGIRNTVSLQRYYESNACKIDKSLDEIMSNSTLRKIFLDGAINSVNNVNLVFNLDDNSDIKDEYSFFFSLELYSSVFGIEEQSRLLTELGDNFFVEDHNFEDFENNVISKVPKDEIKSIYYLVFLYKISKSFGLSFYPAIYKSNDKQHGIFQIRVKI